MTQSTSEAPASHELHEHEDASSPTDASNPANVIKSDFRKPGRGDATSGEPPASGAREPSDPAREADPALAATVKSASDRLGRLERQNRWMRLVLLVLVLSTGYLAYEKVFPEGVVIQKTMMESKEIKLLDSDGNARLFLRMYSRVPVLQLMDGNGKPRMSLGLRFDDTPFLDLSDKSGRTRATLEMTEHDAPALRLFDEDGNITFNIN